MANVIVRPERGTTLFLRTETCRKPITTTQVQNNYIIFAEALDYFYLVLLYKSSPFFSFVYLESMNW
jgi:hypothetical protein